MITVLGPLEVRRRGRGGPEAGPPLDIGSPRHREVLAALVVETGVVVPVETVLDRVWGEGARGATASNLHAVISRLRARLRAAGIGAEIVTVAPGYRLDLAPGTLDAAVFHDLLTHARDARATGDLPRARGLVGEGLVLWRGPGYADIRLPFAEAEAARLDGLRVAAYELAIELDLALGQHEAVVDRVPGLVSEHPLRESFRAQLMLALYRSGRQAEALAAYADARRTLSEELGLDPGPELQALHQRILAQDPELDAPAAEVASDTRSPVAGRPPAVPTAAAVPDWFNGDGLLARERDVRYVAELVEQSAQRLITLTGVGGVGKTSLALAVASACRPHFDDGVVVVELAPVTDADLVVPTIGRSLGLVGVEGPDSDAVVTDHLRSRRILVVLDNVEHVLDSAARLSRLVAACPGVTVLVTSRTVLRVRGEAEYQVLPLAVPEPASAGTAEIGQAGAVRLFVERARAVVPSFALDDHNAADVAAICRRLAGIPLAVELAAARVRLLPPAAILERLDEVMSGSGARDLPRRQRTMRAAIGWSHDLLGPEEQRLFRRLSVFVGGFTLEAAEAVGGDGVLPVLESLVEQSLVLRDRDHPDVARFRLLEPVLQYARTRLVDREREETHRAHLEHVLGLVEATEPAFRSEGTTAALALIEREHANVVAATEWALEAGEADLAGRLGWATWLFWWLRGNLIEGRRLMNGVLALDPSPPVRARAIAVVAALSFAQGDLDGAQVWVDGADLARRIGDPDAEAHNIAGVGLVALATGDLTGAESAFRATIPLVEHSSPTQGTGRWIWTLAHVWLATVHLLRGQPGEARPLLDVALGDARSRGDRLAVYIALFTSAQVFLVEGDLDLARRDLDEGIRLSEDTGDMANLAYFLDALSVVDSVAGHHERVGVLHGAALRLRETVGANVYGYYQPDEVQMGHAHAAAERARGAASYAADVARGRGLSMAEMIRYAAAT